jgi:hypothetical protein
MMKYLLKSTCLYLFVAFFFMQTDVWSQSKKGIEYSGTKTRYSLLGKSKVFSEGVKNLDFNLLWNKKKNIINVKAGPEDKWYDITLTGTDTINGAFVYTGILSDIDKETDAEKRMQAQCEIKFLVDKIIIKIGDARLEEYLLDGAKVWANKPITN